MASKWDRFSRGQLIDLLEATERPVGDPLTEGRDAEVQKRELEMRIQELASSRNLLEESRARFAELYDAAPSAYCTLDKDGAIVDCNLTMAATVGVDRPRLLRLQLSQFVVSEDLAKLTHHLDRCFKEKRRVTTDVRLMLRRVGVVPFQMVSTPQLTDAGDVKACRTMLTDVSAVKRSEERLSALAGTSALLSVSFDVAANLKAVARNLVPTMADLCLIDLAGAGGSMERVEVALSSPDREELAPALACPAPGHPPPDKAVLISGGEANATLAEMCKGQETALRLIRWKVRSLMIVPLVARAETIGTLVLGMADSERIYAASDLAFATDLGSRIAMALDNARLYDNAQLAIHARQELLAMVSHDMRSPLSGILLSVGALLESAPEQERRRGRRQLERIKQSVARMLFMVEDLLDMSSLEKGHLSITWRDLPVNALIEDALELLLPIAQDHGVALVDEPCTERLWVHCDRERVLQILSNLIGNALKFTPRGGKVAISCTAHEGKVHAKVKDTGPGISPELLPVLFDRERRPAPAGKGRGLGLFICKGIVEAHGGTIWAESRPGEGATVHFTLPASQGPGVMIVDDDPNVRELLAELLCANGYVVSEAANGRAALEALEAMAEKPQVVLVDLNLPVMDGRAFVREVKARAALADIPVLLLSSSEKVEEEARELGVAGALKKPVDVPAMLSAIKSSRHHDAQH
jgi:PAS domain S-box-containing protein